jgi:hypothetical protein
MAAEGLGNPNTIILYMAAATTSGGTDRRGPRVSGGGGGEGAAGWGGGEGPVGPVGGFGGAGGEGAGSGGDPGGGRAVAARVPCRPGCRRTAVAHAMQTGLWTFLRSKFIIYQVYEYLSQWNKNMHWTN